MQQAMAWVMSVELGVLAHQQLYLWLEVVHIVCESLRHIYESDCPDRMDG